MLQTWLWTRSAPELLFRVTGRCSERVAAGVRVFYACFQAPAKQSTLLRRHRKSRRTRLPKENSHPAALPSYLIACGRRTPVLEFFSAHGELVIFQLRAVRRATVILS